jgi:hypothetical protein
MIIDKETSQTEIEKIRIPQKDSDHSTDLTKSPLFRRDHFIDFDLGFLGGPQKRTGFKLSIWMWLAASVDTLIIASATCFQMFFLMLAIKIQLHELRFLVNSVNLPLTFTVIFLFSGWMYFIAGASIGEQTCSLRLGQPHERVKKFYTARVMIRTTVTLMTGIVTLPLLSLIFKKDVVGRITGLYIYSLK